MLFRLNRHDTPTSGLDSLVVHRLTGLSGSGSSPFSPSHFYTHTSFPFPQFLSGEEQSSVSQSPASYGCRTTGFGSCSTPNLPTRADTPPSCLSASQAPLSTRHSSSLFSQNSDSTETHPSVAAIATPFPWFRLLPSPTHHLRDFVRHRLGNTARSKAARTIWLPSHTLLKPTEPINVSFSWMTFSRACSAFSSC